MRRVAVAVFVGVVLAGGWSLVVAAPAAACLCEAVDDRVAFDQADAVFVGKVVLRSVDQPGFVPTVPEIFTIASSTVYKGDVWATQEIVGDVDGGTCGLQLGLGDTYLVFANRAGNLSTGLRPEAGQYYAGRCGGTRSVAEGPLAPGIAEGRPPAAVPSPPAEGSDEAGGLGVAPWFVGIAVGLAVTGIALLVLRQPRAST